MFREIKRICSVNISQMGKLHCSSFKSPFRIRTGMSPKERDSGLEERLNYNEEYKEAFRTQSYLDMWREVQGKLRRTSLDGIDRLSSSTQDQLIRKASTDGVNKLLQSTSSTLPDLNGHLSDYLSEPQQNETLTEMAERLKFHHLLINYSESSLEACDFCELLLRCIHQTRRNYRRIKRVIKLSEKVNDSADYNADHANQAIIRELASYALLKNPLSFVSQLQLHEIHDSNVVLLKRLISEHRKIKRKAKFNKLVGCYSCLWKKKTKLVHGWLKKDLLERFCAQFDAAAKGTYILINDFNTMGRLLRRLYDEIEHRKTLADMCARVKKTEILNEVVREFCTQDSCYLEQIEELEQHVYLCFHTINRSRMHVIQLITAAEN